MSDVADDPFGLNASPVVHDTAAQMTRLLNGQEIALASVPYVGLLIALFGMSLLMLLLAPDRQRRALGERLLPERGAVAQTMLGLLGLVLPLFSLLGLPVLLIAAPLGWGAWLTTGRKAPPPA